MESPGLAWLSAVWIALLDPTEIRFIPEATQDEVAVGGFTVAGVPGGLTEAESLPVEPDSFTLAGEQLLKNTASPVMTTIKEKTLICPTIAA